MSDFESRSLSKVGVTESRWYVRFSTAVETDGFRAMRWKYRQNVFQMFTYTQATFENFIPPF